LAVLHAVGSARQLAACSRGCALLRYAGSSNICTRSAAGSGFLRRFCRQAVLSRGAALRRYPAGSGHLAWRSLAVAHQHRATAALFSAAQHGAGSV